MDDDSFDTADTPAGRAWRRIALPLVTLIVVVAAISGLVLGGVVGSGSRQDRPAAPTTTVPTVQIRL